MREDRQNRKRLQTAIVKSAEDPKFIKRRNKPKYPTPREPNKNTHKNFIYRPDGSFLKLYDNRTIDNPNISYVVYQYNKTQGKLTFFKGGLYNLKGPDSFSPFLRALENDRILKEFLGDKFQNVYEQLERDVGRPRLPNGIIKSTKW